MKIIRDLFTGIDGTTWDLGRVLLALGCVVLLAGGIGSIIRASLDFVAFGAGFGGLLTGGGALLLMKRQTEPQATTATTTDARGNTSSATVTTGLPAGDGQ